MEIDIKILDPAELGVMEDRERTYRPVEFNIVVCCLNIRIVDGTTNNGDVGS